MAVHNNNNDFWSVIIQLITGGSLVALLRAGIDIISTLREKGPVNVFKNISQIYDELSSLKRNLNCDRIHISYTSNGGGVPSPGVQLYTTVLYEVYSDDLVSLRERIQNLRIDEAYSRMLVQVIALDTWESRVAKMEKGFFKDICLANHISFVKKQKIKVSKNKFFYLSCIWNEGSVIPTKEAIDSEIFLLSTKLRGLLKK